MDNISIPKERYEIHKSLVREDIITHPRVRQCSTKWRMREVPHPTRPYQRQTERCKHPKECPICSYLQDRKLFLKLQPIVNLLKENEGDIHLLTLTLRHNTSHSYTDLIDVLHRSIQELKCSYPFKKYYGTKDRLFSLQQYENAWSPFHGYHPHAHLHIGTTNRTTKEEVESSIKSEWVKIVSRNATSEDMIPNLERGCSLEVGRDDPFYIERKSLDEEIVRKLNQESAQQMKERFRKSHSQEELISELVSFHATADETNRPDDSKLISKIISVLKTFYSNFISRYRLHLTLNKRHFLFNQSPEISQVR